MLVVVFVHTYILTHKTIDVKLSHLCEPPYHRHKRYITSDNRYNNPIVGETGEAEKNIEYITWERCKASIQVDKEWEDISRLAREPVFKACRVASNFIGEGSLAFVPEIIKHTIPYRHTYSRTHRQKPHMRSSESEGHESTVGTGRGEAGDASECSDKEHDPVAIFDADRGDDVFGWYEIQKNSPRCDSQQEGDESRFLTTRESDGYLFDRHIQMSIVILGGFTIVRS